MSTPDKILLRKIKKREKNRLKLLQLKSTQEPIKLEKSAESNKLESKAVKRSAEEPHNLSRSKKKKKKKGNANAIVSPTNNENDQTSESDNVESLSDGENGRNVQINNSVQQKNKKNKKKPKRSKALSDDEVSDEEDKSETEGEDDSDSEADESPKAKDNKSIESALPGSSLCLGILSDTKFSTLKDKVCEATLMGVQDMGFTTMTEIQAKSIPPLLEGRDLVGAAKTGSGKTLAFLIPAIELINKLKFMPRNGTGCIIISPTRELSMQTFGVLKELMTHHHHTYGLLMGGANRTTEAQKLSKGINIVVATPGRLLDHLQNTPDFLYKNLQCLIIDEADSIV